MIYNSEKESNRVAYCKLLKCNKLKSILTLTCIFVRVCVCMNATHNEEKML